MIIPVRCFTCGKVSTVLYYSDKFSLTNVLSSAQVVGNKWNKYLDLIDRENVSTS